MRRILQAPGRRGRPPRPQPLGRRGRRRRARGGRPGRRGLLVPGRARRVLRVPRASCCASAAPGTSRCSAAAAASSCPTRSTGCATRGVTHLLPRGRPAARPGRHDQPDDPRLRRRPVGRRPDRRRRGRSPATGSPWPGRSPAAEAGALPATACAPSSSRGRRAATVPVLGITGTGGSGKSSLTDELVRRLPASTSEDKLRIAVRRRSTRPGAGAAAPCSATGSG